MPRNGYADSRRPAPLGTPGLTAGVARDIPVHTSGCPVHGYPSAYVVNVTAVPKGFLGFVTLWPGQPAPTVSTLNAYDGNVVANMAIVPVGIDYSISAVASNDTDLIVDITGYFAPPIPPLGSVPLTPLVPPPGVPDLFIHTQVTTTFR